MKGTNETLTMGFLTMGRLTIICLTMGRRPSEGMERLAIVCPSRLDQLKVCAVGVYQFCCSSLFKQQVFFHHTPKKGSQCFLSSRHG